MKKAARDKAEERFLKDRAEGHESKKVTLENLFATLAANQSKVLKVVVKADTQGSVEAIVEALNKIAADKVSLEIHAQRRRRDQRKRRGAGVASSAIILGFHTRVDSTAAEKAKHAGVQIKLYAIIYELIDQVKEAMAGLLDPEAKETVTGQAEVRQIFELSKGVPVAGCMVASAASSVEKSACAAARTSSTRVFASHSAVSRTRSTKSAPAWNAASGSKATVNFKSVIQLSVRD